MIRFAITVAIALVVTLLISGSWDSAIKFAYAAACGIVSHRVLWYDRKA